MVGTSPPTLLARVGYRRRRHHNRLNLVRTKTAGASQHGPGWKAPHKLPLLPVVGEFFLLTFPSYRTGLRALLTKVISKQSAGTTFFNRKKSQFGIQLQRPSAC